MGSQNYLAIGIERLGNIMLDDRRMKASDIYRQALKHRRREDYNPPNDDRVDIRSVFDKGGLCFYVKPKGKTANEYFMYIHGGGFISQITHYEWRFVFDTVDRTGYCAVVPIYPLAPEHNALEALEMLVGAYDKVCSDSAVDRMVLVGNSSGGCLALSSAIQLWKIGSRRPDKIILASPVLDTEFPDKELERMIKDKKRFMYRYYHSPAVKQFLARYWVRGAEGRFDVTSPVHYDITDICDEMAIFTVDDDLLNCYARTLYKNAGNANMKVHYYEYTSVVHDYLEHPYIPECRTIMRQLGDTVKGDSDYVPADIENDIWCRAMFAERYPKLYEDAESIRLSDKIGIDHKMMNSGYSFYDRAVVMERLMAIDARVRNFVNRFSDGIVVNVGCELDTMFGRVDNGRIRWYSVDLPERIEVRRKYMDIKDRETYIDSAMFDYSWLDSVAKPQGTAILFVLYDMMKYFDRDRLRAFLDAVWRKFPGAEVVLDAKDSTGRRRWNLGVFRGKSKGSPVRAGIDNCTSLMYDWNIKYRILCDDSILRLDELEQMFSAEEARTFCRSIRKKRDKVIHLRLGNEHFLDGES